MTQAIQIRPLTIQDRKKLSAMIQKLAAMVGDQSMLNLISSQIGKGKAADPAENEKSSAEVYTQVGLTILRKILEVLEEETHEWFSDLIGVTKEDFLNLPIDTEVVIIQQIVDSAEASSFFTKALQLFNRIKQFQNKQGK